jgi:3-oxoacyl-[acyl-carrier protein] reductase
MDLELKGKRALVCGSTDGIGLASAIALANEGAEVVLMARDEKKLNQTLTKLNDSFGQKHSSIKADFANPNDVLAAIDKFLSKGKTINILVNNTGGPAGGPIIEAKTEAFLASFNQHLICNHILATQCLDGMISEGYGRIINIISTSVKVPLNNLGVSNTIRGAVGNWSKTLANEVGKFGITVNNILPGATDTQRLQTIILNKANKMSVPPETIAEEMKQEIPLNRFAKPEEVANAVLFLASPKAAYISGINLPVDGGRTPSL